jgi:hypothetical protein
LICRILCVGALLTLGTMGAAIADPMTIRCSLKLDRDPIGSDSDIALHAQPPTKTFTVDGTKYYYVEKQFVGTLKSVSEQAYSLSDSVVSLSDSYSKLSESINRTTGEYAYSESFADTSDTTHDSWEVSYRGSCARVDTIPFPAPKS